jgi:hypothetical protein
MESLPLGEYRIPPHRKENIMFWDIVIVAGLFWIIMSFFSFMQTLHVRNIYKVLEPAGEVYHGQDAGFLRTRYLCFAAVDQKGKIIDARLLKASRIVTMSKILPFPEIIGQNFYSLNPENMILQERPLLALKKMVENFSAQRDKKGLV